MFMTGSGPVDAERAFSRVARARRRAAFKRWVRRRPAQDGALAVFDEHALRRARADAGRGIREIPMEAIRGTLEPSKAALFDRDFRPSGLVRSRWQRLWLAEQRGSVLPPISVVPVGTVYAIRDGHHRVSVARARGACTIDAVVNPGLLA